MTFQQSLPNLSDFKMRLSRLAILVVLSVALCLSQADDSPKNIDAPREVERRDAPALNHPVEGQQQAEAGDGGKSEEGV
jgi:hypothetical protein